MLMLLPYYGMYNISYCIQCDMMYCIALYIIPH